MLAGVSDDDEVRARDIRVDDEGRPVFTLDFGQGETTDTMLAIPGVQSVPNAVKAAAVAYRLGVTPEQIDAAFRGLTITGHRQEIKRAKSGARVIDDSYNASAESMAAGLDLLCSWAPMPPPRSSTCWRAWVVSWPSLWPMPRA